MKYRVKKVFSIDRWEYRPQVRHFGLWWNIMGVFDQPDNITAAKKIITHCLWEKKQRKMGKKIVYAVM